MKENKTALLRSSIHILQYVGNIQHPSQSPKSTVFLFLGCHFHLNTHSRLCVLHDILIGLLSLTSVTSLYSVKCFDIVNKNNAPLTPSSQTWFLRLRNCCHVHAAARADRVPFKEVFKGQGLNFMWFYYSDHK